jgi:hypothetical protein
MWIPGCPGEADYMDEWTTWAEFAGRTDVCGGGDTAVSVVGRRTDWREGWRFGGLKDLSK